MTPFRPSARPPFRPSAMHLRRHIPDPFVIAVLLTALTAALALALTDATPARVAAAWSGDGGVWSLLKFGMQMCLILVTGHAVASSPPVARLLERIAAWPRSAPQAVWLTGFAACLLGLLNWGLGLIGGALLAREVGRATVRKGIPVPMPLLAASAYLCMMVWHGGLSGSAPLKVTTLPDLREIFGPTPPIDPIPLSRTTFSLLNLWVTGGLVLGAPLLMAWLAARRSPVVGRSGDGRSAGEAPTAHSDRQLPDGRTTPDRPPPDRLAALDGPTASSALDRSPLVTAILVVLIGAWAWRFFLPAEGPSGLRSLTPDSVNLLMLLAGLVLHRTPIAYVRAIEEAAGGCAGIILQFPLYAGIMGMMQGTGLTALFAERLAATESAALLPFLTFLAACVINLFVPSGGGQWAVQGPIAVQAGVAAGADPAHIVLGVAYGDQLTNMLQPFWALPLLAIARVEAREIVGYTALVMLAAGAWIGLGLLLVA